jgi:hypothetical protein
MRKIQLKMEDLAVESFDTASGRKADGGTVQGYDWSGEEGCSQAYGCNSGESLCATCDEGCPEDTSTCFASCRMTDGSSICIEPYC